MVRWLIPLVLLAFFTGIGWRGTGDGFRKAEGWQQHDPPGKTQPPTQGDPTFTKDMAWLLAKKCLKCHVPDGHAPFSLITYAEVKKRAGLIRQEAIVRRMPPTDGTSDYGMVASQDALTDEEIVMIQEWVRLGMPEGDAKDAPPEFKPPTDWPLGKPDLVLTLPKPKAVPDEGRAYWMAYTLPAGKLFGKRLRAVDVRAAAPKAVRQVVIAQDPKRALAKKDKGGGLETFGSLRPVLGTSLDFVATWAQGCEPWFPRMAPFDVTSKDLAVQVLYQPTGKPEDANVEMAFYFSTEPPSGVKWVNLTIPNYTIKPEDSPTLTQSYTVPSDSLLYGLYPEARFYCVRMNVTLRTASREESTILSVYTWDPYWPGSYLFRTPVGLPKGSKIVAEFLYDNSKHGGLNDGKEPKPIPFGNALDQEMFGLAMLIGPAGN